MNISTGKAFGPKSTRSIRNRQKELGLTATKVNNYMRPNENRKKEEHQNSSDSSDLTINGNEKNMIVSKNENFDSSYCTIPKDSKQNTSGSSDLMIDGDKKNMRVLKNWCFDSSVSTISAPKKSKRKTTVLYSSSDSVDTATYIRQNQKKYTKISKYKNGKINNVTYKSSNEKISLDINPTSSINSKLHNKRRMSEATTTKHIKSKYLLKDSTDISKTVPELKNMSSPTQNGLKLNSLDGSTHLKSIITPATTLITNDCESDIIDNYNNKGHDFFPLNSNAITNQTSPSVNNHTESIEILTRFLKKCCTKTTKPLTGKHIKPNLPGRKKLNKKQLNMLNKSYERVASQVDFAHDPYCN